MFAIKIHNQKKNRTHEFNRTISNIVNYIFEKLSLTNVKITSDDACVEIVSGIETETCSGQIIAELLIKKTIVINTDDLKDREKLDKYITEIKNFCEQAKSIEELKYIPIEMRR